MTTPPTQPAGVIHDLAYRRYEGARLGPATRFAVIARYAVRAQWRLRAVKLFLLGALLAGAMGAVALGFRLGFSHIVRGAGGGLQEFDRGAETVAVTYALAAQYLPSLLLVLVCGAPSIAADLNAGAFQFHFARPVGTGQYLAGRMLGAVAWPALFSYATVGAYCVERLAFVEGVAASVKLLAVGALGVTARLAALGAVALGCSSLTRRAGLAQAMFLSVVLGSGVVAAIVEHNTRMPWVATLSVMDSGAAVCAQLLGADEALRATGLATAAPSLALLAWIAGPLAVAWLRVRSAEVVRG
jgi:ABC-2 type transport system permease protein